MKNEFDPDGLYDVIGPEGSKVGEINKGVYYEGAWQVGGVAGSEFIYNGQATGRIEGLTLTRSDPPGTPETRFLLVPNKTGVENLDD